MRVDAVLYTHSHADHILGLDELRRFNAVQEGAVQCYATQATWDHIRKTFHYVFDTSAAARRRHPPAVVASDRGAARRSAACASVPVRSGMDACRCSGSASAASPT
jgi:glyoxylase-like metal-dependent hydrolase (beta-lactamase superfamily II)